MKRLIIQKLIVISQIESRSLEIPFKRGLNIILGGNKTGKSSIIKSIFTTLGCDCKSIEADWKKLISSYLLFFDYGNKQFCIVRQDKKFQIFEYSGHAYSCIIETEEFHKYSNCLMDILEINMENKIDITIASDMKVIDFGKDCTNFKVKKTNFGFYLVHLNEKNVYNRLRNSFAMKEN